MRASVSTAQDLGMPAIYLHLLASGSVLTPSACNPPIGG